MMKITLTENRNRKKGITGWLIMVFLFSLTLPSYSAMDLADSAAIYYDKKNYGASIRCYEGILKSGQESWKLHYNLGNAYFKNNELGKAILHYEIAKKMNPVQADLLNNLRIANSRMQDKVEVKENFLQSEIRQGTIHLLSTSGWAWLSILTLAGCLGLFFLFMISSSAGTKKLFFWSAFGSFIIFALSMILGFAALKEKNSKSSGVIISSSIPFYNEPRSGNKKPFQLHEGTRVRILDTDGDWVNVQLLNGNEGWVKSEEVGVY